MLLEKTHVDQPLLTVEQAARILSMNVQTVRKYLREGLITAIKINNREWRIRPEDLERFLEKNKRLGKD